MRERVLSLGGGLDAPAKEAGDPGARRFIALPAAAGNGHSIMEMTMGSADETSDDGAENSAAFAGEAPAVTKSPAGMLPASAADSSTTVDAGCASADGTSVGVLVAEAASPAWCS